MSDLLQLLVTILIVLAAAYLPGFAAVRILGGSRLLALGLAPALGTAVAGSSALVAPFLDIDWSLLPFAIGTALVLLTAAALRRLGVRLPSTVLDGRLSPPGTIPGGALWLVGALCVAVVPLAMQARRPDAVLERWDTLYHLSALARIRESGTASSLDLGSVSNSAGAPTVYPAGFHALASLAPGVEVPIMLNGAVLALAVMPWVLGIALLARTVNPKVPWAPFAAAMAAVLTPATPLNLWVHLSPVPNLSGFAALPGAVAAAAALWGSLLPVAGPHAAHRPLRRAVLAAVLVVGASGIGLALLHPNVAVTALILLTILTTATAAVHLRTHPWLFLVPLLLLAPLALLSYTPLGAKVTGFSGGLQVPWWTALGEILLGLLTVWPMAFGVVLAALWWPGLVTSFRSAQRWVGIAWVVVAVIYLDAALDSPLNLSILYYRGQDRISMPLAMLSAVLMVPGLQCWSRLLPARRAHPEAAEGEPRRTSPRRLVTVTLVAVAVVTALASVPTRSDDAAKNFAAEYPGRARFLQADEVAEWKRVAPQMDPDLKVIASPFSGASHMYAITGQQVYFPVAGMTISDEDRNLTWSVPLAADSPVYCQSLEDHDIGYIYQERTPYSYDTRFSPIERTDPDIGNVLFETSHSRLIEIDCKTLRDLGR